MSFSIRNFNYKKTLVAINIIGSPILTVVFYSFTTFLIPQSIFESEWWFFETPLRVAYISFLISLIILIILVLRRERVKIVLLYAVLPFIISVVLAPITLSIATTVLIFLTCFFKTCLL